MVMPVVIPPKAIMSLRRLCALPKTSRSGARESLPSFLAWRKARDSVIERRIQSETATRTEENQKGMRQPQSSNADLVAKRQQRITESESRRPSDAAA